MKKMNNLFKKICLWSLVVTMASCDFLDTKPYDFVAPETFYQNEKDCTMALAGVYYTLVKGTVYGNNYSLMFSNTDDLSYFAREFDGNPVKNHGAVCNTHDAANAQLFDTWTDLYDGINNANVLLDNIDKAEFPEDKEYIRQRIKGETKFLRAYYHFLLVQGWYEVPIRTETVTDIATSSKAATPHAEALDWIIQEMEDCIDMLDDKEYDKSPSHVKKTIVEGILARVCLWRAGYPSEGGQPFYEKAAKYAKAVYDSKKHKLYQNDIYAIWKMMASDQYDPEYNESMWEAEFIGTRDDGKYTEGRMGNEIGNMQNANCGKGYGAAFYAGSLILWDLYEKNPGDLRRDLAMAPYQIAANGTEKAWGKTAIVERCCGKFRREWEKSTPQHKNFTEENFPILRYADVLLMLAEAELESKGVTTLAVSAINEVRTRAGIGKLPETISADALRQEIRDERGRELCFEALRKYDLIRWGIYVETISKNLANAIEDARWSNKKANRSGAEGFTRSTQDKHQFLPIPNKELSVNTKLEQNSYWNPKK